MKAKILIILGIGLIFSGLGLSIYNISNDITASKIALNVNQVMDEILNEESDWKDKYQEVLNMEMPTIEIDGHFYVGRLDIEALGLSLPVMNSSSSSNLKIAPCRYYGSVYTDDMVIAAHNYRSHFARLNELTSDDIVKFTDVDGNEFFYQVVGLEVLKPTNVDLMIHSDYDLTLYTCTYGGASRITIRCIRIS